MCHEKEYHKIATLLRDYRPDSENICEMILGYGKYLDMYGKNMTAYSLRTFKKTVINTIMAAERVAEQPIEWIDESDIVTQEDTLEDIRIDFCIENKEKVKSIAEELKK